MAYAAFTRGKVIEDSAAALLARIELIDGSNALQADIESIEIGVWNKETGAQVGETLAPAVASVIFDTLQTTADWQADTTGYNFRAALPGSYWPDGDSTYQAEVTFTPVDGDPFKAVWLLQCLGTYTD